MDAPWDFEVRSARPQGKEVLRALLQLYMYDFSEFAGGVAGADGRFHYHDGLDARWEDSSFHPFVLWVRDEDPRDGVTAWRPAGFATVANATYFSAAAEGDQWLMDDFFIMRKYRRAGAGTMLALVFRPLSWPLGSRRDGAEHGGSGLLAPGHPRLYRRPLPRSPERAHLGRPRAGV